MGTGSGRLRAVPVPISTLAPPENGDRHLEDSEPVPIFRLRSTSRTDSELDYVCLNLFVERTDLASRCGRER